MKNLLFTILFSNLASIATAAPEYSHKYVLAKIVDYQPERIEGLDLMETKITHTGDDEATVYSYEFKYGANNSTKTCVVKGSVAVGITTWRGSYGDTESMPGLEMPKGTAPVCHP